MGSQMCAQFLKLTSTKFGLYQLTQGSLKEAGMEQIGFVVHGSELFTQLALRVLIAGNATVARVFLASAASSMVELCSVVYNLLTINERTTRLYGSLLELAESSKTCRKCEHQFAQLQAEYVLE